MALTLLYGQSALHPGRQLDLKRSLTIALVQANIDQSQKWDAAHQRETMDRYRKLTDRVAKGADLVIWPEAATPFLFERDRLSNRNDSLDARPRGSASLWESGASLL